MDTLVTFGSEIKTVEETADSWKIGGYLVVFGTQDASNLKDKFTRETDFDIEDGDRTSIYYNHGLDGTIKRTKLGDGQLSIKDAGVWFQGELKKRTDYLQNHVEKIADGMKRKIALKGVEYNVFGLSSGAPAHLVERVQDGDGHIVTKWPLRTDASITPTPAEPLTAVGSIKSLDEIPVESEVIAPDEVPGFDIKTLVAEEVERQLNERGFIKSEPAPTDEESGGETKTITITDAEQQKIHADFVRAMTGDPALLGALTQTA